MSDQPGELPEDDAPEAGTLRARVEPIVIEDEMRSAYLDYAMSVIVGRALPDVRDGLKPVHRRILFSMDESGLRPDRPYRKCASAVGDVMKKYHPHGDSSIYDALVRMGQDFSSRYMLIDGHGNFGSVDGDSAAAMRYTEARLSRLATELLRDIGEDTVDFADNYDGYEREPVVLPARFPNLLANGSTGIAVGMATNIPPHNLGEVIDATIALVRDPELTAIELMQQHLPAPDFPTGGLILGQQGVYDAYTTGRGSIKVRAVTEIMEEKGREVIVVTEIPYMVNKARLIEKMAQLHREKVLDGISNVRDESSSRIGMRIVIEVKRSHNAQVVLNKLFKHTQLQDTFGANMLALVDGIPKTLPIDAFLRHYIDHQVEVITRRTQYRLDKAEERAHLLEGLLRALDLIDEIIDLIRNAPSAADAKTQLIERFAFSDLQATEILNMQLRRLAALERQRLQDEYDELAVMIAEYRDILANHQRVLDIVVDELTDVRERFADARRSQVVADDGAMSVEDLIPEHSVVVTITRGGYIKRTPQVEFRSQARGGVGVRGAAMKEDDVVSDMLTCSSHDILLVFSNQGRVYRIKAHQVPEKSRVAKGVYVANVPGLAFEQDETVATILKLGQFREDESRYLFFATRKGVVKRSRLTDYDSPRSVLIAINLRDGDELIGVAVTDGERDVMLVSRNGQAIRFDEDDARPMGRTAAGVTGMKLRDTDHVLAMAVVDRLSVVGDTEGTAAAERVVSNLDRTLLTVSERGLGKRTPIVEYSKQGRGGYGNKTANLTDKTGALAGAVVVETGDEVLLIGSGGTVIRTRADEFRQLKRATSGVRVMNVRDGAEVIGIARVLDDQVAQEVEAAGDLQSGDLQSGDLQSGDLQSGDLQSGDLESGHAPPTLGAGPRTDDGTTHGGADESPS